MLVLEIERWIWIVVTNVCKPGANLLAAMVGFARTRNLHDSGGRGWTTNQSPSGCMGGDRGLVE